MGTGTLLLGIEIAVRSIFQYLTAPTDGDERGHQTAQGECLFYARAEESR